MRLALALLGLAPSAARWCQVESVKADVYSDYTFAGPWRVDGCTTLSIDHGKCTEDICPHRIKFVDDELVELADALHGNTVLTALSIMSNNATDETAKALAEALRDNEVLQELNLNDCQIGDEGATALAEVFHDNPVFITLNIENNRLTDDGGRALLELLKSNASSFETVYAGGNKLSPALLAEIADEMKRQMTPPEGHLPVETGTVAHGDEL